MYRIYYQCCNINSAVSHDVLECLFYNVTCIVSDSNNKPDCCCCCWVSYNMSKHIKVQIFCRLHAQENKEEYLMPTPPK